MPRFQTQSTASGSAASFRVKHVEQSVLTLIPIRTSHLSRLHRKAARASVGRFLFGDYFLPVFLGAFQLVSMVASRSLSEKFTDEPVNLELVMLADATAYEFMLFAVS